MSLFKLATKANIRKTTEGVKRTKEVKGQTPLAQMPNGSFKVSKVFFDSNNLKEYGISYGINNGVSYLTVVNKNAVSLTGSKGSKEKGQSFTSNIFEKELIETKVYQPVLVEIPVLDTKRNQVIVDGVPQTKKGYLKTNFNLTDRTQELYAIIDSAEASQKEKDDLKGSIVKAYVVTLASTEEDENQPETVNSYVENTPIVPEEVVTEALVEQPANTDDEDLFA